MVTLWILNVYLTWMDSIQVQPRVYMDRTNADQYV